MRAKEEELQSALKREHEHRIRAEDLERHNGGLKLQLEALLRDVLVERRQAEELQSLTGVSDGGRSLRDACATTREARTRERTAGGELPTAVQSP